MTLLVQQRAARVAVVDGSVGLVIGVTAEVYAGGRDASLIERQHRLVFANVGVSDHGNVGAELKLVERQRQRGKRRIAGLGGNLQDGKIEILIVVAIRDV